jgi:hypothetical protein
MATIHYDLPDDLHRRAKAAAALRGITLKAFLIQALDDATKSAEKRRAR